MAQVSCPEHGCARRVQEFGAFYRSPNAERLQQRQDPSSQRFTHMESGKYGFFNQDDAAPEVCQAQRK
jgi:hypothetical protein